MQMIGARGGAVWKLHVAQPGLAICRTQDHWDAPDFAAIRTRRAAGRDVRCASGAVWRDFGPVRRCVSLISKLVDYNAPAAITAATAHTMPDFQRHCRARVSTPCARTSPASSVWCLLRCRRWRNPSGKLLQSPLQRRTRCRILQRLERPSKSGERVLRLAAMLMQLHWWGGCTCLHRYDASRCAAQLICMLPGLRATERAQ
jgi:hypothetical protein